MNSLELDTSLEELARNEYLSVRSINVCDNAGLKSLREILKFQEFNGSFASIRNCGVNSDEELINFCRNYKDVLTLTFNNENDLKSKFRGLNPFQRSILNRHFDFLFTNLSVRARNGLNSISESSNQIEILENIIFPKHKFKSISNIGIKTVGEINLLKSELIQFINKLISIPNDQLGKEYTRIILKTTIEKLENISENELDGIFDIDGKVKLFQLINFLITTESVLNKNETVIFKYTFFLSQTASLETIAKELNLTRERVRQIRLKLTEEIHDRFSFISNFKIDDVVNYGIDDFELIYVLDINYFENINQSENVRFNPLFYIKILGYLVSKSHTFLGDIESVTIKKKMYGIKEFNQYYLISNKIIETFDFEKFVEDVHGKLIERIAETYQLHFKGYLSQFLINDNRVYIQTIADVCEQIINNEFELFVNSEGYIVFERTVKQQIHEYCYEILNDYSNPMTVEEIERTVNSKYPDVKTTIDSIRGSLNREKELFIYFGRSSSYGLRKWEQEKENLKGGTIRDIVAEFLLTCDEPQHITEIVKFIAPFRNTNAKSVFANIKMDESNRFVFYKNSIIGIKGKEYKQKYLSTDHVIKSWHQKFEELKSFRKINPGRWPSITTKNREESALYLFGYKSKKLFFKNKLEKSKEELLRSIDYPLDESPSRSYDWVKEFEKVKVFVTLEKRWPSSTSVHKEERALNRFLYINKKAFISNELDETKTELLKSINFLSDDKYSFLAIKKLIDFLQLENRLPAYNAQSKEEIHLYRTLNSLRKSYRDHKLDADKLTTLEKLNFDFNLLQ